MTKKYYSSFSLDVFAPVLACRRLFCHRYLCPNDSPGLYVFSVWRILSRARCVWVCVCGCARAVFIYDSFFLNSFTIRLFLYARTLHGIILHFYCMFLWSCTFWLNCLPYLPTTTGARSCELPAHRVRCIVHTHTPTRYLRTKLLLLLLHFFIVLRTNGRAFLCSA